MTNRIQLPPIEPFKDELLQDQKAIALKPLEEAAEVFGAWQAAEFQNGGGPWDRWAILYEIADVMQACVNLAYMLHGADAEEMLAFIYDVAHDTNDKRGRYADD